MGMKAVREKWLEVYSHEEVSEHISLAGHMKLKETLGKEWEDNSQPASQQPASSSSRPPAVNSQPALQPANHATVPKSAFDHVIIDVDEWDHEQYPLTQPSERFTPSRVKVEPDSDDDPQRDTLRARLGAAKRAYNDAAYASPATAACAPVSQDLSRTPDPFLPAVKKQKPEPKATKPTCCFICDKVINPKTACREEQGIQCDGCFGSFHLKCAKLKFMPRYRGSFPCPLGCNPGDRHGR